jgi:hypothetical protein
MITSKKFMKFVNIVIKLINLEVGHSNILKQIISSIILTTFNIEKLTERYFWNLLIRIICNHNI